MIAYLSGAMENAKNEGSEWRNDMAKWLKEELNHSVIDPIIETQKLVQLHNEPEYRKYKETNQKRFIKFVRKCIDNDLDSVINKTDYTICLWNNDVILGGGTHGEVTMGYYFNKPVYLVNQLENMEVSGWILSCATEIFPDFISLKNKLLQLYGK